MKEGRGALEDLKRFAQYLSIKDGPRSRLVMLWCKKAWGSNKQEGVHTLLRLC